MERIYSAQEYDFCWQTIIVLRSWKGSCGPICYSETNLFSFGRINFCYSKDLFLSNRKDFLIPIQNATKTRDFLPIFRFNFKIFRSAALPRCQITSHLVWHIFSLTLVDVRYTDNKNIKKINNIKEFDSLIILINWEFVNTFFLNKGHFLTLNNDCKL